MTFTPTFDRDDPAERNRLVRASMAAQARLRPRVDHNGKPLPLEQQSDDYRAARAEQETD